MSRREWWNDALQQVDNDKDFLMEICGDLKEEVEGHLIKIESALQGTVSFDAPTTNGFSVFSLWGD